MAENDMTQALVLEWLEQLPKDDTFKLAQHLRRLGVKGIPGSPMQCPIAEYLRRRAEEAGVLTPSWRVSVTAEDITVWPSYPSSDDRVVVKTPDHVTDFVALFDVMSDLRVGFEG